MIYFSNVHSVDFRYNSGGELIQLIQHNQHGWHSGTCREFYESVIKKSTIRDVSYDKCLELEHQLKETLQEFGSAHLIIELLK